MLRWLIGGGREPQGLAEKSSVQTIGEDQIQNPYTELLVLRGHQDIVRFLVQIDDCRFASAGDDGVVFLWNAQTGEKLFELRGHTHKITAIAPFSSPDASEEKKNLILTASADRTVIIWDCTSGRQVQKVSCFHSTVKCLTVLQRLDVWLSGGSDLCVWNRKLDLLCKTSHLTDAGISALVELPKNCVAAAVGKELSELIAAVDGSEGWNVREVKRLVDHQDNILSLVSVNDLTFVTGSHVGELIVWDALDWTKQVTECNFWDSSVHPDVQPEIKLSQSPNETSVQHLTSDEECVFAAVGKGIYVYNLQMKRVIACQRAAHDSSVLHIEKLPNRQLISCSEDGSVRIWELREKQQLPAEPVPTGFFSMWGFGRANRQANQAAKKVQENTPMYFLELVGDLIGHSSAVQTGNNTAGSSAFVPDFIMFLYFGELGLATCSADHLIILWKDGERESRLRSLTLFQKLAQNGDLQLRF
ncbi:WD repeat-containing protein 41 isoform X2 [Falco biarmicus]|uniref:WD repeat-containing protein 41 isoform X2 n=1 Tax=Falco cherrug TaxID=345164 RepID=UPI00247864B8|nr:WD repeat-containing protein 41 isoform X2 [Falco cherrug]XP_056179786.1 WD repeat-containing protein 41 isoform X2 [Falco biarmicus]